MSRNQQSSVGGLLLARHFGRLGLFGNTVFGSDPEGDDQSRGNAIMLIAASKCAACPGSRSSVAPSRPTLAVGLSLGLGWRVHLGRRSANHRSIENQRGQCEQLPSIHLGER